eukprot:gnl/MRDRNA2_/MRDRNA2_34686_c0_seq1.p1 gnl/MRDRNA2_/MRDRNA2_34686_c0~~gnl/MRDRNA2_/MRDRNA2_34686_c0_seq1.p1  ORF type:complete len:458 (-),score=52.87 gnl/MRDRNA2_/MRDRNA2_34686_c0_seq1:16-1341(-)
MCDTFLTGLDHEEECNNTLAVTDAYDIAELRPVSPLSPLESGTNEQRPLTPPSPLPQLANDWNTYTAPEGRTEYIHMIREASASCLKLAREENPLPEMHRVLNNARTKLKKEHEKLDAYIADVSRLQDGLTTSASSIPPLKCIRGSGVEQQPIPSEATLRPVRSQGHLGHGQRVSRSSKGDNRDVVQRSRSQEVLTRLDAAGEAVASFLHYQAPAGTRGIYEEHRAPEMKRPPSAARRSTSGSRPASASRSGSQQPTGSYGAMPVSANYSYSASSRPPSAKPSCSNSRPPSAMQSHRSSRPPSASSSGLRSSRSQCDISLHHHMSEKQTRVPSRSSSLTALGRSASLDARHNADATATTSSGLCDKAHGSLPRIPHCGSAEGRRGIQVAGPGAQLPQESIMDMPLLSRLANMSRISRKGHQGYSSSAIRSASCHILNVGVH